jgi:DNA-binding Lrp family transcriptional regulator
MIAYVLINTELGAIPEVIQTVRKIEEVKEAYSVFGVYDIITKVEAVSLHQLKKIVTQKIRCINQVRSTLTMIVMDEP